MSSALFEWFVSRVMDRVLPSARSMLRGVNQRFSRRARVAGIAGAVLLAAALALWPRGAMAFRVLVEPTVPLSERAVLTLRLASSDAHRRVRGDVLGPGGASRLEWRLPQALITAERLAPEDRDSAVATLLGFVDPACRCWNFHRGAGHPPHIPSTAWSLYALGTMEMAPPPTTLDFLLDRQLRAGAWSLHGAADQEFSSTYATAVTLLALQVLVDGDLIERRDQIRAKRAIARGHDWLIAQKVPGAARWMDYPETSRGVALPSVSGLVLHTLHAVNREDLRDIDHAWVRSLPPPPGWRDVERSGDLRVLSGDGGVPAEIEVAAWPWLVLGTVSAYGGVNYFDQHVAATWLHRAISRAGRADPSARGSDAEVLLAVRVLLRTAAAEQGRVP